jgi:hypothetical protein
MNRASIGKVDRRLAAASVDQHGWLWGGEFALQLGDAVYRIRQLDLMAVLELSHPASLRAEVIGTGARQR